MRITCVQTAQEGQRQEKAEAEAGVRALHDLGKASGRSQLGPT